MSISVFLFVRQVFVEFLDLKALEIINNTIILKDFFCGTMGLLRSLKNNPSVLLVLKGIIRCKNCFYILICSDKFLS